MTSDTEPPLEGSAGGSWPFLAPAPPVPAPARLTTPPTFSVVVAAYQAAGSVGDAVDSALDQTRAPLEVVVCDDGSTDDTSAVLERFGDRIRVVRQPNQGESAAKNTAVKAARGDYVVVLDADDLFHPRRLEALGWLAEQRPDLDILTTDAVLEANGVAVRNAYHRDWIFPADDQRSAILDRNFVLGLCAVRRERWLRAGGFDPSFARAADWEFWLRLILDGSRVGLIDHPLARYRLSSGTLSSDRTRLVRARLEVLRRAGVRTDLSSGERAVVRRAVRRERQELRVRRLDAALPQGGREARAAALALLVAPATPLRARLGASLAALVPAQAARRRERRWAGTVEIGAGLRVPQEERDADEPSS